MKNDKTDFRIGDIVYLLEYDDPEYQKSLLEAKKISNLKCDSKFAVIVDIEYPKDIEQNEFSLLLQALLKKDVTTSLVEIKIKAKHRYMTTNSQGKDEVSENIGNYSPNLIKLVARKII
jgi:uncharacterized HAD superfamily protein